MTTSDFEDPAMLMSEDAQPPVVDPRNEPRYQQLLADHLDIALTRARTQARGDVIETRNALRTVALAWIRVATNDPHRYPGGLEGAIRTILARLDVALRSL